MDNATEVGDEWPIEESIPGMAEANEIGVESQNEEDIPGMAETNEIGVESQNEEDIPGMAKENEVGDESENDENISGNESNKVKEDNKTKKQSFENLVRGNNSFNLRRQTYIKKYGNENSPENSKTRGSSRLNLSTSQTNRKKSQAENQNEEKTIKLSEEALQKIATRKRSSEIAHITRNRLANAWRYAPQPYIPNPSGYEDDGETILIINGSGSILRIPRVYKENANTSVKSTSMSNVQTPANKDKGEQENLEKNTKILRKKGKKRISSTSQSNNTTEESEDMIPERGNKAFKLKQTKSAMEISRNESSDKKHAVASRRNSQATNEDKQNAEKNTKKKVIRDKETTVSKGVKQISKSSVTTPKQAKGSNNQNSRKNVRNSKKNTSHKNRALKSPALRKHMTEDTSNSKDKFETSLSMENDSSVSRSSKGDMILKWLSEFKCPQDMKNNSDVSTTSRASVQKLWNGMSSKTEKVTNSSRVEQGNVEDVDSGMFITELGELQIVMDRENLSTADALIVWLDEVPERALSNHFHRQMSISKSKGKLLNDTDIMQRKSAPDLEDVVHSKTNEYRTSVSRLRSIMASPEFRKKHVEDEEHSVLPIDEFGKYTTRIPA